MNSKEAVEKKTGSEVQGVREAGAWAPSFQEAGSGLWDRVMRLELSEDQQ